MPIYDLPIWAADLDEFPPRGIAGKGWRLRTRQVQFRNDEEKEIHFLEMRERYPRYSIGYVSGTDHENWRVAAQVFVEATSRAIAQRVCDLLRAALCAIDGSSLSDPGELLAVPNDRTELELEGINEAVLKLYGNKQLARSVLVAARLAAKCSRHSSRQYALLKLNQSFELASTDWIELDPANTEKYFGVVSDRKAHVAMASAVTLAYSVIEELQLEPKPKGPNREVKVGRVWNPDAFGDLTDRLEAAGIDLRERIHWTVRGSPTRIHRSNRAPEGDKQPYSRGSVRDTAVSVQDALVAASWLRSKCSTHRYVRETESITMFDVHNVQFLARRLILESVGLLADLTGADPPPKSGRPDAIIVPFRSPS